MMILYSHDYIDKSALQLCFYSCQCHVLKGLHTLRIKYLVDRFIPLSIELPFINPSINHSIHQLINHSFNHSMHQAIIQSFNQSFNHSIIQSASQSFNQSFNQPINQPIHQSINQCQKGRAQVLCAMLSCCLSRVMAQGWAQPDVGMSVQLVEHSDSLQDWFA